MPRVTEERHGSASLDRLASVDLNLLVPLLALLEECSVTKAAARVGLSQPAMSHALSRLRRLLSDDLLVRQGASMTITPRAAELIVPLRRTLDQVAHVVRFPGFDPTTDRRVVTVALTMSTAFELGGPLARFVAERAPLATLRLHTITVPDDSLFTTHGVDVALLPEAFASPFPRERLYDDRWVVVAAKDAAPADAATIDLLRTLPHVAFESSGRRVLPYAVLDERRLPLHGAPARAGQPPHTRTRRPCRRRGPPPPSRRDRHERAVPSADRGVSLPGARAGVRHGLEPAARRRHLRLLAARHPARGGRPASEREPRQTPSAHGQRHTEPLAQLVDSHPEGVPDDSTSGADIDDREVGVDPADAGQSGERQGALRSPAWVGPACRRGTIITKTCRAPMARSIAPPTAGWRPAHRYASSPDRRLTETWKAPSTQTSRWPPRIIAKESAWWKYDAPGSSVTGSCPR